jgi:hypothetical protein
MVFILDTQKMKLNITMMPNPTAINPFPGPAAGWLLALAY